MITFLVNLLLFSAQVALIVGLGGLVLERTHRASPRVRFVLFRTLLVCAVALPLLVAPPAGTTSLSVVTSLALATPVEARDAPRTTGRLWPDTIALLICAGLMLGALLRLAMMMAGVRRLGRLAQHGTQCPVEADIEAVLNVTADVRIVDAVHHPITFGLWRPLVLIPTRLAQQPDAVRRAVLCHELLHVRRRDWMWLVLEECVRTTFWFHPAVSWLISRMQLTREELVDSLVVRTLGQRKAYIQALLAFSDTTPFRPAPAFGPRDHLARRIQLVSKEVVMSPIRTAAGCALFAVVVTGGGWYGARALPLQSTGQASGGPLERQARRITPENPIPRRTYGVLPQYPQALVSAKLDALVTVNITVDSGGRIAESRVLSVSVAKVGATRPESSSYGSQFEDAVTDALRQWQYDAPFEGPIAFPVSLRFLPNGTVVELTTAADVAAPTWHDGAVRIGNGVLPPPVKIKDVRPTYPAEAAAANTQGIVILEVRIEPDGKVRNLRVMRSIPALDQAAMDAVKQWEFQPALLNGAPTAVVMFVTVNFTRK